MLGIAGVRLCSGGVAGVPLPVAAVDQLINDLRMFRVRAVVPGSMATTLPDNPAPETRLVLDVLPAVVVGAAVVWVSGTGVGDAVVDQVALVALVADDGVVRSDVVLCDVAVVGVDDTAVGDPVDLLVLGWVTGCSGISVARRWKRAVPNLER